MYLPISSVKGIGMYESKISDKRWLILGLLSDIGWIMLFAGIVMYMANGADGLGTVAISALFLVTLLSAVFVLFGVIALITQRMRKIDRVLTKRQLVISFGFVVFGALTAAAASMGSVFVDALWHYETGVCFIAQCLMYAGGLICFAFGYPIFKSFKKR